MKTLLLSLLIVIGISCNAQKVKPSKLGQNVEWRHYGNDAGGQRFAKIDQVTPANVNQLKEAWTSARVNTNCTRTKNT